MLFIIPVLTFFLIGAIYPLCFWVSADDPLKNNFHHFHLGFANFFGSIAVGILLFQDLNFVTLLCSAAWAVLSLCATAFFWNKDSVNPKTLTLITLLGLWCFAQVQIELLGLGMIPVFINILGGGILCLSLFAMNLGHWYLNVPGLPIKHLMKTVYAFWGLIILRALWDIGAVLNNQVLYEGELVSIYRFVGSLDGFLILLAIFFGTLFPLITLWFVRGTLQVKSTQSATGILYVIVSAVLIGDMTYKYYLLKFGLSL